MTSTESYTAVATQTREITEKSVESWKQGAETFTDQANVVAKLPKVDLTQPVARYFEFVQKTVDLNRDLATRWAELVTSMSGTAREQAEKVGDIVKDQTEDAAGVSPSRPRRPRNSPRSRPISRRRPRRRSSGWPGRPSAPRRRKPRQRRASRTRSSPRPSSPTSSPSVDSRSRATSRSSSSDS